MSVGEHKAGVLQMSHQRKNKDTIARQIDALPDEKVWDMDSEFQ